MKLLLFAQRHRSASALLTVMVLGSVAIIVLASTMRWTSNNAQLTERNIQYFDAVAAAEAATEKVMAELNVDFARMGVSVLNPKLPTYRTRVPKDTEHSKWGKYKFSNGLGDNDEVYVDIISPWQTSPLISQYEGLSGYAATYRIRANALDLVSRNDVKGAVQQEVQLALVPIFQFAIFYNMDMEVNPGAKMNITGLVHGNDNIYLQPGAPLTFLDDIKSAGQILHTNMPGDPTVRVPSTITFKGEDDSGVLSLNLPIGSDSDNSPEAVRAIVEIPPKNESPNSDLGKQRFYNLADLVIVVTDAGVEARGGGLGNGNGANLSSDVGSFVRTDASFYDNRENKTIKATEIDIAKFNTWNANSTNALKNALKRDINSIYIADIRSQSGTEPGIRLVNGSAMPPLGLTIATPDPLYVKGNYNASGTALGSSDTSSTKPAALIADSINILSGNWNDANSTSTDLKPRAATDTTVNAAFLAGIVSTVKGHYSGGVENFPRFHENWSGRTFTYNGSMIVLFNSLHGDGYWPGTGGRFYNPPNRNWNFDSNFLDPGKLPPLCPSVRAVIRGQWSIVRAY